MRRSQGAGTGTSARSTTAPSAAASDSGSGSAGSDGAPGLPVGAVDDSKPGAAKGAHVPLVIDWVAITLPAVREHMPKVKGLTVGREVRLATRWRVCYPRAKLPKSCALVYINTANEKVPVLACLRFVWTAQFEESGQLRPFPSLLHGVDVGELAVAHGDGAEFE